MSAGVFQRTSEHPSADGSEPAIKADVGSPNEWFGYSTADQVLRVLSGNRPVSSENNPLRLFVPSNIKGLNLKSESPAWYGNVNFVNRYNRLWGKPPK